MKNCENYTGSCLVVTSSEESLWFSLQSLTQHMRVHLSSSPLGTHCRSSRKPKNYHSADVYSRKKWTARNSTISKNACVKSVYQFVGSEIGKCLKFGVKRPFNRCFIIFTLVCVYLSIFSID